MAEAEVATPPVSQCCGTSGHSALSSVRWAVICASDCGRELEVMRRDQERSKITPMSTALSPLSIGGLQLQSPVMLAPMAGYTDLPFRITVRRLGGLGLAYSEMLSPHSILQGKGKRRKEMLATALEDNPLGYQLTGSTRRRWPMPPVGCRIRARCLLT